jgi:hypothetical protein
LYSSLTGPKSRYLADFRTRKFFDDQEETLDTIFLIPNAILQSNQPILSKRAIRIRSFATMRAAGVKPQCGFQSG